MVKLIFGWSVPLGTNDIEVAQSLRDLLLDATRKTTSSIPRAGSGNARCSTRSLREPGSFQRPSRRGPSLGSAPLGFRGLELQGRLESGQDNHISGYDTQTSRQLHGTRKG